MIVNEADITIHRVESGDTQWLEPLLSLYVELLPGYAHYAPLMRERALHPPDADPRWIQHQWVVSICGAPCGLMVFKYLTASRLGLLLDMGIRPAYRHLEVDGVIRIANYLYRRCLATVCDDAARLDGGRPLGLLAEAPPGRLIRRYVSYGFVELPVEYLEPPDTPELDGLGGGLTAGRGWRPMRLLFLPAAMSAEEALQPEGSSRIVEALLTNHYRLPYNHWAVREALDSLH